MGLTSLKSGYEASSVTNLWGSVKMVGSFDCSRSSAVIEQMGNFSELTSSLFLTRQTLSHWFRDGWWTFARSVGWQTLSQHYPFRSSAEPSSWQVGFWDGEISIHPDPFSPWLGWVWWGHAGRSGDKFDSAPSTGVPPLPRQHEQQPVCPMKKQNDGAGNASCLPESAWTFCSCPQQTPHLISYFGAAIASSASAGWLFGWSCSPGRARIGRRDRPVAAGLDGRGDGSRVTDIIAKQH